MNIFRPFTFPRDSRWQGFQHHHHTIFLIKNTVLLVLVILVIIEYRLFITWWNRDNSDISLEYAPYSFWLRIGIALIPDLAYTLITLALIFQTPTLSLKGRTWNFHPAFALTFSIVLFGLYVCVALFNGLIVASNEVVFYNVDTWYNIGYAETAFQGMLALCYVGMMVCACVAVHRWRGGKKSGKGFMKVGKAEVREGEDV